MPRMTAEELAEHLKKIRQATVADLDDFLADLLAYAWPTHVTQNS